MLFFASWIFLGQADSETFSAALPLSLSVPLPLLLSLFFSLFSLSSSVTLQSLPFCFSFNFRRDYCVIAGDRQSVVVDVSLSFLTDTQPSALFSVSVYPSHPRRLHHNTISCVYWREGSVSIDTTDNIPVFWLLARGGHIKTEARGEAAMSEVLDRL